MVKRATERQTERLRDETETERETDTDTDIDTDTDTVRRCTVFKDLPISSDIRRLLLLPCLLSAVKNAVHINSER